MTTVFVVMIELHGRRGVLDVCPTEAAANTACVAARRLGMRAWFDPRTVEDADAR